MSPLAAVCLMMLPNTKPQPRGFTGLGCKALLGDVRKVWINCLYRSAQAS